MHIRMCFEDEEEKKKKENLIEIRNTQLDFKVAFLQPPFNAKTERTFNCCFCSRKIHTFWIE